MQSQYILVLFILSIVKINSYSNFLATYLESSKNVQCFVLVCSNKEALNIDYALASKNIQSRKAFINIKTFNTFYIFNSKIVHRSSQLVFILNADCVNATNVLYQANRNNMFRKTYKWVIFYQHGNFGINTLFTNISIRKDSNINVLQLNHNYLTIYTVYYPGINSTLKINYVGRFMNDKLILKNTSYYNERKNMSGTLVRSGNVVNEMYLGQFEDYIKDLRHKEKNTFSKLHYSLFEILMDIHQFRHNMTSASIWFGKSNTGIDDGVAKLLYENTIDISITGGILRYSRINVIDFLMTTYKFRANFLFRNPGLYKKISNEMFKPFSVIVWLSIIATLLVICLCMKAACIVEYKLNRSKDFGHWSSIFIVIVTLITQQGSHEAPSQIAGRIVFLNLCLLSMILYNYFTSAFVSILLNTNPNVLSTLQQLEDNDFTTGIEDQPYLKTYVELSEENIKAVLNKTSIYKKSSKEIGYLKLEDGIKKIRNGHFAYCTEIASAYRLVARTFDQNEICDLAEIDFVPSGDISFMVQKDSQYKKLFQISLRKIHQSGILNRLQKQWQSTKPECSRSSRYFPVRFNQVFMAFLILFTGIILSLVLLGLEIFYKKNKHTK